MKLLSKLLPTSLLALLLLTGAASAKESSKAAVSKKSAGSLDWGTNGGLTLGGKGRQAVDLNLGFATPNDLNGYGYVGLETHYVIALSNNFDLRVGGRLPFYAFGIVPELGIRYRALQKDIFHLAIDASLAVPVTLVPYTLISVVIDPGVLMSVLPVTDLEIFFGFKIPIATGFYATTPTDFGTYNNYAGHLGTNVGFDIRAGLAYNFNQNIGIFGSIDLIPSFVTGGFFSRSYYVVDKRGYSYGLRLATYSTFDARLKFGVQIKL